MIISLHVTWYAVLSNDDEFEKWQKEIEAAEVEAEGENGVIGIGDDDRPSTPPEGEEEFTDYDRTTYKWDRGLRAWVPQVGYFSFLFSSFKFRLLLALNHGRKFWLELKK